MDTEYDRGGCDASTGGEWEGDSPVDWGVRALWECLDVEAKD